VVALLGGAALVVVLCWQLGVESPQRLRGRAEEAARLGDWAAALKCWRSINSTSAATSSSHLGEARACLALGRAAQAEQSLQAGIEADPGDPDPWRLLLEILRVEDRTLEALHLGWSGYKQVRPESRRVLLLEMTLSLVADLPDELARKTLGRWIDADGEDGDAKVALLRRIAAQPRAADPDRDTVLAQLDGLLAGHPEHTAARDTLVTALADAGLAERGRAVLDQWPESTRDARYWRLSGRWALEFDHHPEVAVSAFRKALAELPQDWRSWYRLARALRALGRDDESRQAAETVTGIREALDPLTLGPRMSAASDHVDDPRVLRDLAAMCERVGLSNLAAAWRTEAQVAAQTSGAVSP
jgi:tetratricopeptide (TPR) repeat protein